MQNHKLPLSVIILTYNEENNILKCLESIYNWVGEIIIVDSYSSDRTLEIARKFTDKIYQHPFQTHAKQWNWAFKNINFSYEWCLVLDADQVVSQELSYELKELFKNLPLDIDGYYIKRKYIFNGRWIRFGGYYSRYLLRLFKIKEVFCDENELVDKHFYVKGKTKKLKNDLIEENLNENDISFWLKKHIHYAELLAKEEMIYKKNKNRLIKPYFFGSLDQKILWLKNIYYHLPLYLRAFMYFFYRYILKLGFLDGRTGFLFHFLQGFWYRLIVDIKIKELLKDGFYLSAEK
ncbi:MAG: glycosyltransferase family 2 protein [Candidatus Omnitrophica bacterium]|nr:glycosyltransferase family 2 protein [Candidatus Omnitrophota bacterium]